MPNAESLLPRAVSPARLRLVGDPVWRGQRLLPLGWYPVVAPPEPEAGLRLRVSLARLRELLAAGLELEVIDGPGGVVVVAVDPDA